MNPFLKAIKSLSITFYHMILLIFKLYFYKSREKKFININNLVAEIRKVKKIEKGIAFTKNDT